MKAQKRTVQCSMGTKLAEKGRKMILEKRKEEGVVGKHEKCDDCDC